MALSYTSLSSGGSASNDFTINIGSTGYTNVTLSTEFPAGNYIVTSSLSDATLDIYLQAADGTNAGYVNAAAATSSLTATKSFKTVIVYGSTNNDTLTFQFKYVFSPSSATTNYAAAPRLISNTPTALVNQNSTTTITGQNFSTDIEIYFIGSDNVERPAKTIVRNSSTQLVVTRPDTLPPAYSPYTIKAVNTGIADPTSTNSHKLSNSVTAGAAPSWVTTSPLTQAATNIAYSVTLSATDADGSNTYSIVSGSLPSSMTLNSSTGVISGTSAATTNASFTIRATDTGGNYVDRAFTLPIQAVPYAPTSVSASAYSTYALVTWTEPTFAGSSSITGYTITSSPGNITATVGVGTSGTITGLTNGTPYTFTVKANNTQGSSAASSASNSVTPTAEILRATYTTGGTFNLPAGFGGNNAPFYATVYAIGGGGGGGGGEGGAYYSPGRSGGAGGGSGRISSGTLTLTGAVNYNVGSAGAAGNAQGAYSGGNAGSSGGTTNFGNLTSLGGGGGGGSGYGGPYGNGGSGGSGGGGAGVTGAAGGSYGAAGANSQGTGGSGSGNNLAPGGGGGGGGYNGSSGAGGAGTSYAGAGATGGYASSPPSSPNGYGGGGGGGGGGGPYGQANGATQGSAGAPGVIYIYY